MILQGQDGGELSQLGKKQADALGKRISKENFEFILVSDLNRTMQTFESIKQFHQKPIEPILEPLLREKHAGVLQGQSLVLPKKLAQEQGVDIRVFRPDQGESWEDVNKRAQQLLQKIQQLAAQLKQPTVKVLLVTHGGFIMEFMNHMNFLQSKKNPVYNNNAQNCSITVVSYKKPGDIKVLVNNDASHIQKL
ncbi:hypothetical protein pb186bvf_016540 [Paramecium bursaria]